MTVGRQSFFLGLVALAVLSVVSLRFGVQSIEWPVIWQSFTNFDPQNAHHHIVQDLRVARILAALIAGASLGVSGALIQMMTRNPLADPGLLGVNGGAAIAVVISIWIFGIAHASGLIFPALLGASFAAVVVLLLGGVSHRNGPDPVRLILTGAALNALFIAMTWTILILSREAMDVFRLWVLGGFTEISLSDLKAVFPVYVFALPLSLVAAQLLGALILGDDTARALGVRIGLVRLLTVLCVVSLCGATVSIAGPITFVGLLVPHLVRSFTGFNPLGLVLGSAFCGACLTLVADVLGRSLIPGREVEAGVVIALIGGPALVVLVRSRREVPL